MITAASIVTLSRVALTPLIIQMIASKQYRLAAALFFCGVLTDFLDGYLARLTHSQSVLGQLLDPIADKLFIGSIGCYLILRSSLLSSLHGLYPALLFWLGALALKEFLLLIGAGWCLVKGKAALLKAQWYGKILMATNVIAVGLLLLLEGGLLCHNAYAVTALFYFFLFLGIIQIIVLFLYVHQARSHFVK